MEQAPPRIPVQHIKHTDGRPCGCWNGSADPKITCKCGAAYMRAEVLSFPRWRCYDCGRVYDLTSPPNGA